MALDYHAASTATDRTQYLDTAAIVSGTERRDVSEILDLLALAETPFINRIGWGPESGGTKIEWISENLGPGYVALASAPGSASVQFDVQTVDGMTTAEAVKQLLTGTVVYAYSSTDGEHMLAVIVSFAADGAACEFEVLSTNAGSTLSLAAGDKLYILGAVANEGSKPRGTQRPRNRSIATNGFTILRQDVAITGSEAATDFYAIGKEDRHQILMRLKEMQREREKVALYSDYIARSSTEASLMYGAFGFLASQSGDHIDTSTTTLTESAFNKVIGAVWEHGGDDLVFFAHKDQCAKITKWDKNRIRTTVNNRLGGGYLSQYLSEVGTVVDIVPMRMVPKNIAFLIDVSKVRLRAKKGRKAIMEKLGKMGDFEKYQLISEFSMEMRGYDIGQHGMFTKLT